LKSIIRICLFAVAGAMFSTGGCSPASPTRIGPSLPPKPTDCEMEIIKRGEKPTRPYRDVGMVALENCPDYRMAPCREWLRKAVCELGGQVVYELEKTRPDSQILSPVTYRVVVAVYVADLPYSLENDPIYKAKMCDPACGEKERCKDGECVPIPEGDCEEAAAKKEETQGQGPERCLE
jgi:hypothetical protein